MIRYDQLSYLNHSEPFCCLFTTQSLERWQKETIFFPETRMRGAWWPSWYAVFRSFWGWIRGEFLLRTIWGVRPVSSLWYDIICMMLLNQLKHFDEVTWVKLFQLGNWSERHRPRSRWEESEFSYLQAQDLCCIGSKGGGAAIEKGERTHDVGRNRKLQIRIEMLLCLSDRFTIQDEIIPLCQKSKPTLCQEKKD